MNIYFVIKSFYSELSRNTALVQKGSEHFLTNGRSKAGKNSGLHNWLYFDANGIQISVSNLLISYQFTESSQSQNIKSETQTLFKFTCRHQTGQEHNHAVLNTFLHHGNTDNKMQ